MRSATGSILAAGKKANAHINKSGNQRKRKQVAKYMRRQAEMKVRNVRKMHVALLSAGNSLSLIEHAAGVDEQSRGPL